MTEAARTSTITGVQVSRESAALQCPGIGTLSSGGLAPYSRTVRTSAGAWDIGSQFGAGLSSCMGAPRAKLPSWSSDGSELAFVGNPPADSETSYDTAAPWNIYVLNLNDASRLFTFSGVGNPSAAVLSPDGSRVAVAGAVDGVVGIWVVDVKHNSVLRMSTDEADGLVWSASGHDLIAFVSQNPGSLTDRAEVFSAAG